MFQKYIPAILGQHSNVPFTIGGHRIRNTIICVYLYFKALLHNAKGIDTQLTERRRQSAN